MDLLNSRLSLLLEGANEACNLIPRRDDIFLTLLERAFRGDVPVYFAIIPRALIRPFDETCSVSAHDAGRAAVSDVMNDWRANKFHYPWVYPHERGYILSDDYVIWAAVERHQVPYVPCWVIGFPSIPGAIDVSGPLEVSVVRLIREVPE